jgi:hypothetical protein
MLRLPTAPVNPFWLEDLAYFAIDEARRLPARARQAWAWIEARAAERPSLDEILASLARRLERRRLPVAFAAAHLVPAPLDEPEEWSLATEPVSAADAATAKAVALHQRAAEQLDALTYVLARLRDEVRPHMSTVRLAGEPVYALPEADQNAAALKALLELSRENTKTRPETRRRVQSAA